ncbi:hypothetical protein PIB30_079852 [Stylosanthes scabra]|uniref:Putative plant transposon protein domain-containing protein n=1 Tax=Stylosanthes scabra TaxID=79078 RepID=A0ABU6ZPW2_9FABA|nr:hypothetical protein [Stylosanthes scabra]
MRWDSYKPKFGRVDNAILTPQARGWQKMIVSNVQPLKHHTTFSINMAILIFTLMNDGQIHLGRIINNSIYHASTGASDQRLSFPVLISRMAAENEVPTFPEDQYIVIEGKDRFCPFGDWQGEKKARKEEPPSSSYCTNLLQKILKKLRQRKKDLRNTQYMICTANPGVEFPGLIPVTSTNSTDDDNA